MKRLALVLALVAAMPATAAPLDLSLRPMARPVPEAPLRPVARPVAAEAAVAVTPPPVEARISTRSVAVGLLPRALFAERMLDPGPAMSAPVAAVATPVLSPLPAVAVLSGADLRPVPRPDLSPDLRPVALVLPAVDRVLGPRPQARPASLQADIAARVQDVAFAAWAPMAPPTLSSLAVAEALRPPLRPQEVSLRASQVPTPAQPLAMGSGLCGVAILSGSVLGNVPGSGACGVEDAVEVTAVGGIRLSTGATMDCATASALARWVERVAHPAVGNAGGGLARIEVAGAYACRGRNNQPGARLSEHAFGRAIDVTGIRLQDGTRLTVLHDWGNAIMRQMHRGACGIFGTVLGPEANRFHRDHFHFDTARYRSGSYCE